MPGSPEPLIPLRPRGSFSPPPFSLCLFHVLLFLSRALYQNIPPFFFSFKIPSPASYILEGKTPQCGNLNPYWLYSYPCSGVVLEICLLKMYPQCWKDLWVGFPTTFLIYFGCYPPTKDGQHGRCPVFWPQTFVPDLILQVTVIDDNPLPGLPATRNQVTVDFISSEPQVYVVWFLLVSSQAATRIHHVLSFLLLAQ